MTNNTTDVTLSISDLSKKILHAQKISNVLWATFCVCGLATGTLQLVTTALYKPLRKMEHSLIIAIAVADLWKTGGFTALAIRRLYATFANTDDVGTQLQCIMWLHITIPPMYVVYFLIIVMSLDRLLALGLPIWYKNQNPKLKLRYIIFCSLAGPALASGMFFGATDQPIPLCSFPTSPTKEYRTFAKTFVTSVSIVVLVLNVLSCSILLYRWRKAVKAKQDMKTFKKDIHLKSMKMLLAVATIFLISTGLCNFWQLIFNDSWWDEETVLSYSPIAGVFELARGVFDFPSYVLLVKDYKAGFVQVICGFKCAKLTNTSVAPAIAPNGNGNGRGALHA